MTFFFGGGGGCSQIQGLSQQFCPRFYPFCWKNLNKKVGNKLKLIGRKHVFYTFEVDNPPQNLSIFSFGTGAEWLFILPVFQVSQALVRSSVEFVLFCIQSTAKIKFSNLSKTCISMYFRTSYGLYMTSHDIICHLMTGMVLIYMILVISTEFLIVSAIFRKILISFKGSPF